MNCRDHAILARLLCDEVDMAYRRRTRLLLNFLDLDDGDRVLDCGCGPGFHLRLMHALRRLDLVGLDSDPRQIEKAMQGRAPATLVHGDCASLPFQDRSFDKVLLTEVLEHVPNDLTALTEIFRVLRPGGLLAISVPHARYPFLWDPINAVWTALGGAPVRRGPLVGIWTNHLRLYQPSELKAVAQEAGFVVESMKEVTHHCPPLAHFLLYGVGKPLVERRLVPAPRRARPDGCVTHGGPLLPLRLVVAYCRAVDRQNDRPGSRGKRTFVNVVMKARKP
jgi:SAM-dependent methyltransferase